MNPAEEAAAALWREIQADPRIDTMLHLMRRQIPFYTGTQDREHEQHAAFGYNLGAQKVLDLLRNGSHDAEPAPFNLDSFTQSHDPDLPRPERTQFGEE